MSIRQLIEDIESDKSAWQALESAWVAARHAAQERARLQRMLDAAQLAEREHMDRALAYITVIRNRLTSGGV